MQLLRQRLRSAQLMSFFRTFPRRKKSAKIGFDCWSHPAVQLMDPWGLSGGRGGVRLLRLREHSVQAALVWVGVLLLALL